MPVSRSDIRNRIRRRLVEPSPKFWSNADIDNAYDDGAAWAHRVIFDHAAKTGMLSPPNHDYLAHFAKEQATAMASGQQDYDRPADAIFIRQIWVGATSSETLAREVSIEDDWHIKNYGEQWGPAEDEALWALTEDGRIRFYVRGDEQFRPTTALPYRVHYYREVVRGGDPVDLEDPWNTGPIQYAVGYLHSFRGIDPTPFYAEANTHVDSLMPMAQDARAAGMAAGAG